MAHEILDILRIHAGVNQICAEAVSQMVCCCMRKLIFVLAMIPINCCPDRFGNVHVEFRTSPRVQEQKTGDIINNGFYIKFCANFNGVLQTVLVYHIAGKFVISEKV